MALDEFETMALPPLETPPLKVSRPVAACSRCRNAKIKCDGKLPACSSCEKNGRAAECTSTNDNFARGKERSYVSTLETRLDKLQAKLEEAQARKPSVVSIPDDETVAPSRRPSQQQFQEPSTPNTSRQQKRREVSAIDDLVSDFGFLSVNATARDFYGFTTAMSYARLILSACTKEELPHGTTKALPPRYTATALIQHYLNNIFVLLPAFDEASFYASVDNVYSRDSRKADPLDHWLVRMVLAVASATMSEQRGDQPYLEGIGHVCAALEHAEAVLHPGNISGVQALVLLSEYAMLDPHHFDSWSLIGAASRAMTDLGLHHDPPKGTVMAKGKLELRRRVFHCIYALDRSTSLVQTRAFSFSDDSAKVKVPFTKQSNSPPASPPAGSASPQKLWLQSYEQALDLINLRKLQSSWYTDLFQSGRTRWEDPYSYLWDTCDAMRKWFDNITGPTTPNMRAFFELDLLYSYVYVLSPSPRVPVIQPFAQKLIFEYCIRYADLMLHLISDPTYTAPLTFYDAMRVYMTGRQFLDVLQHNTDMLLNGFVPPHPEVKPSAAVPPPLPVVPPPQGESIQRFTTVRSINCIKQITECLARFGIRWGYMSWNQRFQNETSDMLEELRQRLQELDEMNGVRRPSMWPQGSTGSVPSSNGSIVSMPYHSPQQQGVSQAPTMYQHTPPPMRQTPSFGETSAVPPQFQQQPNVYQQQPHQYTHPNAHGMNYSQAPPQQYQQHQQAFNFSEPVYQNSSLTAPPRQQFAAWTGYGGVSGRSKLDGENAYVCNMSVPQEVLNELHRLSSTATGETMPLSPRQSQFRRGPSHRALNAPAPVERGSTELTRVDTAAELHSNRYATEIPKTSILPPLTGTGTSIASSSGPQGRRISMHDAALDVLQSTYPPTLQHPQQHQLPPIAIVMKNYRRKGKEKANVSQAHGAKAPYERVSDGFVLHHGIGYVCVACGKVCSTPGLHHSQPDGSGCVDFGDDWAAPPLDRSGNAAPQMAGWQPGWQMQMRDFRMSGYGAGMPMEAMNAATNAPQLQDPPTEWGGVAAMEPERRLSEGAGLFF